MQSGKLWFAFYLKSRSEKKVAQRLEEFHHECFLPLVKTLKLWSDRKKWIWEPLIKSYIFVHTNPEQLYSILQTDGVVKVVRFGGEPAPIPEEQILDLKKIIASGTEVTVTTESFECGEMVMVKSGVLKGMKGMLVQFKGKYRLMLEIDHFDSSVLVTVNANNIIKLDQPS